MNGNIADLIPQPLKSLIRDRYLAGVADAESKFDLSASEEDSLTGGLGNAISTGSRLRYTDEQGKTYSWSMSYRKLRGRGLGAPEKDSGADGIIEIDIIDENGIPIFSKGLPFQSLKNWAKPRKQVLKQARDMLSTAGDGIFVNFSKDGYSAFSAQTAIETGGSVSRLKKSRIPKSLGHTLADDFLDCNCGKPGLRFDPEQEVFVNNFEKPFFAQHRILTTVKIDRNKA